MFEKSDSVSVLTRAKYRHYSDRLVKHMPTYENRDSTFLTKPITEAETVHKKEDDMEHSKLWMKLTGPYPVQKNTTETVTI